MSDLEWKIIYVGSASTEEHDQELDSVLVGPIPMGSHKFVFQVYTKLLCIHFILFEALYLECKL